MERVNLIVYGDGPSGMRLDGGRHFPIYVSKLHKRGRARSAGLRIGDEMLSINGFPCSRMDLEEAQDLVRETSDIQLDILRRPGSTYQQYCEGLLVQDELDTDSSDVCSPRPQATVKYPIKSPISFRTTNDSGSTTIPIFISDVETGKSTRHGNGFHGSDVATEREHDYHWRYESHQNRSSGSRSPRSMDFERTVPRRSATTVQRHVSRAYIVPESNRINQKEWQLFASHVDNIDVRPKSPLTIMHDDYKNDIAVLNFRDSPKFQTQFKPKPEFRVPKTTWQPITSLAHLRNETQRKSEESFHQPQNRSPQQEVIIWSSKKIEFPEREIPPKQEQSPKSKPLPVWKPQFPPKLPEMQKPSPPKRPPSPTQLPTIDTSDSSRVVVNENLIDSGLLTRGFVTVAGVPVEIHLEKKKLYADSSFYQDPAHKYPTIDEQIKMARKVVNLLTSSIGPTGKGQRMFQKRQEMSAKWVTLLDPLVEAAIEDVKRKKELYNDDIIRTGHVGEGPFDQLSRAKRASELEKMRLKEEKSLHNVVPFDLCAQLAHELHQVKGKGGKLFAKIKARAEDWVVSENKPQMGSGPKPYNEEPGSNKELLEFTPLVPQQPFTPLVQSSNTGPRLLAQKQPENNWQPQPLVGQLPRNRLKDMINTPRPIMTPWESFVETGTVEKAFDHLKEYDSVTKDVIYNSRSGRNSGRIDSNPAVNGGYTSYSHEDVTNQNFSFESRGDGYSTFPDQLESSAKFRHVTFRQRVA